MEINYKKLNPAAFQLLRFLPDATIRQIILYGGSSSGKSFSVAQCFLLLAISEGSNMLVMRKVGSSIKESIYASFKAAADSLGITGFFQFKDGIKVIKCMLNGAEIIFKGLDDSEKIKGLERIKRVFMDELNEYDEQDYKQMKLRLRGMVGQQIIGAFNPIKETHWIKKKVYDVEQWHDAPMQITLGGVNIPSELTQVKTLRMNAPKSMIHKRTGQVMEHPSDMVLIQTTYLNNFWVVGSPDGTYGYYDEQCIATFEHDKIHDPDYYNVYALGEWGVIRTGSEFFSSFNRGMHTAECRYNPDLALHVSVDNNVLPYISYTFWQIDYSAGITIKQVDEITAGSPDNTARKSALLLGARLRELDVDGITLHGDASTRNASTIDDQKRSFLDLVISTLQAQGIEVIDKVGKKNPSVPMTGEFINAVFEGIIPGVKILIGEHCATSIDDYLSVQKDENGAILKTKVKNKITMQTYEEHGHLSDTFRYVVADLVREEFLAFSNSRKRNLYTASGMVHFFNPSTACTYSREILYAMPNIGGKFAMVHGKLCGQCWHIIELLIKETASTDEITQILQAAQSPQTIIECAPAYFRFVRDLRKVIPNVKAMNEAADMGRRIAATSDFVKNHLLFNQEKMNVDSDYSAFMTKLLDYNPATGENIEASAVLSGFIQFVIKFQFSEQIEDNAQ